MHNKRYILAVSAFFLLSTPADAFAATWYLPDLQKNLGARVQVDNGYQPSTNKCSSYGYHDSCPSPEVATGTASPLPGLTCPKTCICPTSYQYTASNCATDKGWRLGTNLCQGKANSCDPLPCPSDYTAGLANCSGKSRPSGWTFSSNGWSGGQVCGKCTALTCSSGYSAGITSCSGYAHPEGWNFSSSGYAGDSACGRCTAKTCSGAYTAGTTTCNGDGWNYSVGGYAGDTVCGTCSAKACPSGYTAGLLNCSAKSESWYWKYSNSGKSGNATCGLCSEMNCTEKNALCPAGTRNLDYYYNNGTLRCLMP